uniref:Uncharacterized protein n=1 Tax=Talaromyces marneffei PM1 TaxID=1077442 RepID=A0A093VS01_TALMA
MSSSSTKSLGTQSLNQKGSSSSSSNTYTKQAITPDAVGEEDELDLNWIQKKYTELQEKGIPEKEQTRKKQWDDMEEIDSFRLAVD